MRSLPLLAIALTSAIATAQVPEGPEPNSTPSTATALLCGQTGAGNLNPGRDSDWWGFTITSPSLVRGETHAGTPSALSDSTLTLRDANGVELFFDDDGGTGTYSLIDRLLAPGTYYFDVQSYAQASMGDYLLDLSCQAIPSLQCGTPINATITSTTQEDFYYFVLPQDSNVALIADASGGSLDSAIEVFHLDYSYGIGSADFISGTSHGRFDGTGMLAGTYLVKVTAENGTTGPYRLDSVCMAPTANPLTLNGVAVAGTLIGHGPAEAVWYSLAIGIPIDVTIEIDTPAVNDQLLNMALVDARGLKDDDVGAGDSRMVFEGTSCTQGPPYQIRLGLPAGQFHVVVSKALTTTSCPGSPTAFNLSATGTPITPYVVDPGDPVPIANPGAGASEMFAFDSLTPTTVFFAAETQSVANRLNTTLFLWDPAGRLVDKDDDAGPNRGSYFETPIGTGTYHATVRSFRLTDPAGNYIFVPGLENEIVGTGIAGSTFDLRCRGDENDFFALLVSPAPASLPLPPAGTILIDPVLMIPIFSGVFSRYRVYEWTGIPVSSAYSGATLFTQTWTIDATLNPGSLHFTNVDSIAFP